MKNKITNNKTIKVTQIKSTIGRDKRQKINLLSLGLKKIGNSKLIIINKSTEGLIKKINHLVKIEKEMKNTTAVNVLYINPPNG